MIYDFSQINLERVSFFIALRPLCSAISDHFADKNNNNSWPFFCVCSCSGEGMISGLIVAAHFVVNR